MQLKPIAAILVLFLVVASLLVAGCTASTTSNTNQTPSATPSPSALSLDQQHAFLEKYLAHLKNSNASIVWINNTSARVGLTMRLTPTGGGVGYEFSTDTMNIVFPTTQDATNYLNSMDNTAYNLNSTQYSSDPAFQTATGHAPQIYKLYKWSERDDIPHSITQEDNLIIIETDTRTTTYS